MLAKRVFDVLVVLSAIPVWVPIFVMTAVLVRLQLGAPILFRQARPGYRGRVFEMLKFRTMTDERDATGGLLPDNRRLTKFGRWLRSTSMDEVPELLNVLVGEMSLVGPRPLLTQYLARYSERQSQRHDVPPGLTGWTQINGRNALSWQQKFELDLWYVEHRSFALDVRILARTFWQVAARRGISAPGSETMPEFLGNDTPGPSDS